MDSALPFPSERPLLNGALIDREQAEFRYQESDSVAQMGVRIFAETTPTTNRRQSYCWRPAWPGCSRAGSGFNE